MSEISKQALKVDNNTSFPNNTTGYISPTILRAFNVNMIDSLVEQEGYNNDSSSWNVSIGALNTYTASFAPSLSQLNSFTASQLVVNSNLNLFTQSANASITNLDTFSSSFNTYTASINQIRSNGVTLGTSTIFNLVGPGTFFSASLVQNIQGNIATLTFTSDNAKVNTSSFNDYTASTAATQSVFSASVATSFSASNATFTAFSASQNNFNLSATASLQELLNLSSSLSGGYATQGELDYSASVLQANIDTKVDSASFNSFTASQFVSNSYFATTGSNVFTGDQTFTDASGNFFTITDTSGSMMLVAKGYTSASAHITSSAASKVNIIFKNNDLTGTIYLSGSNNIFTNPDAPTAGFKRILGNNNINLFIATPQVSASMGDYVSIDNNFITARNASPMTIRGPVSSSVWDIKGNVITQQLNIGTSAANHAQGLVSGLFVNNCYIGSNLSVIANRSNTTQQSTISNSNFAGAVSLNMNSSSIDFVNNTTAGGTITINNNTTGSARATATNNAAYIAANIFGGNTTITLSGSNDPNDAQDTDYNGGVVRNLILGNGIGVRVNTGLTGSNALAATAIIGNSLIVTGSSQNPVTTGGTNLGSAFFGRYNAVDGNRALSAQTVFAVGTGTSSFRKTGFLIDSGSNTFVEGTLNVSGATSLNGNLIVTGSLTASLGQGLMYVGNASGLTSTFPTASLAVENALTSSITRNVVVIARNNNASTLSAGTVVHITSAVGDNPVFTTASYDTEALSSNTFGLLRYSSAPGADVEVKLLATNISEPEVSERVTELPPASTSVWSPVNTFDAVVANVPDTELNEAVVK